MNATQTLGCAVIGVTDKSDDAAQLIRKLLLDAGCEVPHFSVVADSARQVKGELAIVSEKQSCRAIIFVGGSEISPRGSTVGALLGMFEQRIEGFGELFRHVIYEQFGSKAVLVRAAAGIYRGRIVLSVPTSASFVQLGMEKLILPELGNMVAQIAPRL
jgi:molybdenum cofactor biosynthesis protein B